jgi:multidrug efflux pump subunit AcrA (membrane-fusion protein)
MLERFKTMSPDEQQQFIARMKERGIDTSAFDQAKAAAPPKPAAKPAAKAGAETIDALFAPLVPTESTGRAWLYVDKQLKPVRLRLGITDGQYTELLSGELQPGMELVTSILGAGTTRANPTGSGNPLMGPQRGMRGR